MPQYFYKAKNRASGLQEGFIEANDRQTAVVKIMDQGFVPLEILEKTPVSFKSAGASASGQEISLRRGERLVLIEQLSDLIGADLPLPRVLAIMAGRTKSPTANRVIFKLQEQIQDGASLSGAMVSCGNAFPPYFSAMVRAGEMGGQLKQILQRLCQLLEQQEETFYKVSAALVYPVIVMIVGFLTVFGLLTFVVPRMTDIFSDIGPNMPLITKVVLGFSQFLAHSWWILFGVTAAAGVWFKKYSETGPGRAKIDKILLKMPFVGDVLKMKEMERLARVTGTMLQSGVEAPQALQGGQEVVQNTVIKAKVKAVLSDVIQGKSMAAAFEQTGMFPEEAVSMIAVGQESGQSANGFLKWAESYERQLERKVKVATTLIEPVLILLIGITVGTIVLGMLLPIFQMDMLLK